MFTAFTTNLNELLIENGLTQSKLAEKLNIDSSTISKYLSENQSLDIDIAIDIADFFNCSLDYLFGLSNENKSKTFVNRPPFETRFLFLLKHFKVTRYKLQKGTDISKSTMYYWQIGKSKPTMDSIIKLAKYFECSIDFVIGRTDFY